MDICAEAIQRLFDSLPDVVFFVKDRAGRYTHVNLTLMRRLGLRRRDEVLGRTVCEVFNPVLACAYAEQDKRVLAGERIENHLEVHVFPNRAPGWCLTRKEPLLGPDGICGLVGISRDLGPVDRGHPNYDRLRIVLNYLEANYGKSVRVQVLADLAGVSVAQLERHMRRVFQLTPQQLLAKYRIEAAMRMLAGQESVATIARQCGFADQSAFTRQFRATVGVTPRHYRQSVLQRPR